ncbi:MAG: YgdI/YgdR family lipoprotein [Pantoea sp.]|nr:YgdI/YgdR family lipoprotein [Pantoea sp.]
MKKLTAVLAVCTLAFTLTACSSNYVMHTNDGRTIISDGKPSESDAGLLAYKDANGVKQQINKADVKAVSEVPNK